MYVEIAQRLEPRRALAETLLVMECVGVLAESPRTARFGAANLACRPGQSIDRVIHPIERAAAG